MERAEILELHFIAPTANLPSILDRGILSHERAARLSHVSVASEGVQARRETRRIPGGLRLHQYANLYLNARNAMLFFVLLRPEGGVSVEDVAILRIRAEVLDLPGVVITDINAAADVEPRWHTVDEGLPLLNHDEIFSQYWNRGEFWEQTQRKQRMQAEVLVPNRVDPGYISGAYVVSQDAAANLSHVASKLVAEVNPYMFFKGHRP